MLRSILIALLYLPVLLFAVTLALLILAGVVLGFAAEIAADAADWLLEVARG